MLVDPLLRRVPQVPFSQLSLMFVPHLFRNVQVVQPQSGDRTPLACPPVYEPPVDELDAPEPGVELLTFLVSAFRTLQDRWERSFSDQRCAPEAPWSLLIDDTLPDNEPMSPSEQLMWHAEETVVVAAQAVGHHLGLLARAYWLDPLDPHGSPSGRWLYSAPYASARAIAEGTAMVRWILDPVLQRNERVRRAAVLALWSDPACWEPVVRAARLDVGHQVRPDGSLGPPFVRLDERSRPLSQTKLVNMGHGRRGSSAYGRWSPLVHHDPRATFRRSTYRVEPGHGRFLGVIRREDEHLEMTAEVAAFVGAAAEQQGAYFGRDVTDVIVEVKKVRRLVSEALPIVRAQIEAVQPHPSPES